MEPKVLIVFIVIYLALLLAAVAWLTWLRYKEPNNPATPENLIGNENERAIAQNSPIIDWIKERTEFWAPGANESVKFGGVIDRVYAIVLPSRKEKFEERVKPSGILEGIWELKAMPKDKLPYDEMIKKGIITEGFFKSYDNKGRIACHMSHLACIIHFLASGLDNCLILEDDSVPLDNKLKDHIKNIYEMGLKENPGFNMIHYSYNFEPSKLKWTHPNPQDHAPGKTTVELTAPLGRQAIWFTKESAKIVLLNTLPMNGPGDVGYRTLIKDKKLKTIGPLIRVFNQDQKAFKSTLGNDTGQQIPPQWAW